MDSVRQDIRLALRRLRARPATTLTVVAVLAFGIGATLVVAAVVDAVLLRPLDYPQSRRIVTIEERAPSGEAGPTSFASFDDLRQATGARLHAAGAYRFWSPHLTGGDGPVQLRVARVSNGFFDVFGLLPEKGRWFDSDENEARSAPLIVLSHALWQQRLGGRDDVVGTMVRLDGEPYEIVGVMPARFAFPTWADAWVPLGDLSGQARDQRTLGMVARLGDGTPPSRFDQALDALGARLRSDHPETFADRGLIARPLLDLFVGSSRPALATLLAAVLGLLLIVSLNVATLQTAGAIERGREIAVRIALGAGRVRVLRQLVTENLMLAGLGGVVGLVIAVWGIDAAIALGPQDLPRLEQAGIDLRLAGFALVVTTVTGLVFGLAPAVRATRGAAGRGLAGARSTTAGRHHVSARGMLVSAQVAVTVALLLVAGLTARSLFSLLDTDLGFDADRLATTGFVLPPNQFADQSARDTWVAAVLARIDAVPGAEHASTINITPFSNYDNRRAIRAPGQPAESASGEPLVAREMVVSPDYFETAGIPLLAGRDLSLEDGPEAPPVVVVNRRLAERIWGDTDVIGRPLTLDNGQQPAIEATVVGLVADTRHSGMTAPWDMQIYRAYRQAGWQYSNLVVRAAPGIDPQDLLSGIRQAVWQVDPERSLFAASSIGGMRELTLAQPRFRAYLLAFFATFALLLAAVGIYSVLAVTVRHRQREIGIRLTLGAARRTVRRLVLRQGMSLVGIGLLLGLPLAAALARFVSSQLYGVEADDPITAALVVALVIGTSYAAVLAPAWRAARVDPVVVLRDEE